MTPYNHSQQVSLLRSETLLSIFIFTSSMIQYQTGLLSEAIAIACSLSLGSSHHDDQSTRTRPQGTSPEHTTVSSRRMLSWVHIMLRVMKQPKPTNIAYIYKYVVFIFIFITLCILMIYNKTSSLFCFNN